MRVILPVLAAAFAVACQPVDGASAPAGEAAPAAQTGAPPALKLTCGAPFTQDATGASLAAVFGAANMKKEVLDGREGEKLPVTVIYPDDPKKRLEVTFMDAEKETGLISAEVKGLESDWYGPEDIQSGEALAVVETANGVPFQLSGFEWDYGGYVTDWKGGKFANPAPKCRTVMRFTSSMPDKAVIGDSPFMSDLPAMQNSTPRVESFSIAWETPEPK